MRRHELLELDAEALLAAYASGLRAVNPGFERRWVKALWRFAEPAAALVVNAQRFWEARDLADNLVTGFANQQLRTAVDTVTGADGLIGTKGVESGRLVLSAAEAIPDRHGHTHRLDLADATVREWDATVVAADPEQGIVLDRSAFYPGGGGQPPDEGVLLWGGVRTRIAGTRKGDELYLVPVEGDPVPPPGTAVRGALDDERSAVAADEGVDRRPLVLA
mgnify:CR=1 FL=1